MKRKEDYKLLIINKFKFIKLFFATLESILRLKDRFGFSKPNLNLVKMLLDRSHTSTLLNSTSKNMELLQAYILYKEKGVQKLRAVYPEHEMFILQNEHLSYKQFKALLGNL